MNEHGADVTDREKKGGHYTRNDRVGNCGDVQLNGFQIKSQVQLN